MKSRGNGNPKRWEIPLGGLGPPHFFLSSLSLLFFSSAFIATVFSCFFSFHTVSEFCHNEVS